MGKRELIALLSQFVIVVFPDHTHLLYDNVIAAFIEHWISSNHRNLLVLFWNKLWKLKVLLENISFNDVSGK